MNNALFIIDTRLDRLWLHRLKNTGLTNAEPASLLPIIFNLDQADSQRRFPYWLNLIGWRHWFRRENIHEIHCYALSPKILPLLYAVSMHQLPVYLHLTGPPLPKQYRILKTIARRATSIVCPARYVKQQLHTLGIDNLNIQIPNTNPNITLLNDKQPLRRESLSKKAHAPLLLAIESPDNYYSLKTTAWAAAMVYRVHQDTTLVVAGNSDEMSKNRLTHLETIWNCPNLIRFVPPDTSWDELIHTCDLLVGGSGSPQELIRLAYATPHTIPIVMPEGPAREFFINRPNTHLIRPYLPRHLATAALKCLDMKYATIPAEQL